LRAESLSYSWLYLLWRGLIITCMMGSPASRSITLPGSTVPYFWGIGRLEPNPGPAVRGPSAKIASWIQLLPDF